LWTWSEVRWRIWRKRTLEKRLVVIWIFTNNLLILILSVVVYYWWGIYNICFNISEIKAVSWHVMSSIFLYCALWIKLCLCSSGLFLRLKYNISSMKWGYTDRYVFLVEILYCHLAIYRWAGCKYFNIITSLDH
jgi:hypothetical protein